MATGSIYFLGGNPEFAILHDEVIGLGGSNGPTLQLPIKFDFSKLGYNRNPAPARIDLISLKGNLNATEQRIKFPENTNLLSRSISNESSFRTQFQFLLTNEIVNKIEKYRNGDLNFTLELSFQASIYKELPGAATQNHSNLYVSSIENGSGTIQFQISQSHWVKRVLPGLGYGAIRLIELPGENEILGEEYKKTLDELEAAKGYFVNGDYDKAVSHCRIAIEPFKKQLQDLKEHINSGSEFDWIKSISTATSEWLEKLLKASYGLTSKPHHPPSLGHFSRKEAESILIITTGIVYYIGGTGYQAK